MASEFASPTPFRVQFPDDEVERMMRLIRDTRLPDQPPLPEASWDYGVDLAWLKSMRDAWLHDFDWKAVETEMNAFDQFTVPIESITVHFIHQKSPREDAVPIILLHGWPGSFWEFHPIINLLTHPPADQPAFHVVVPSLPGFGFSSPPVKKGWTMEDNARLFDSLMTGVLGYPKYFVEGGDFGSMVCIALGGDKYPACKLVAITGMAATPTLGAICTAPFFLLPKNWRNWLYSWIYTEDEINGFTRVRTFLKTGLGYLVEQATRPCTIGYALNDSPVGLLAWTGEKYQEYMDPSIVPESNKFILTTVSLYFLTHSFVSSTLPYHENVGFTSKDLRITKPYGAVYFPFDTMIWPVSWAKAKHRKMVYTKKHGRGGHFPGFEVPELLADDLREMLAGQYELFV